jgi:hypothetical protein
MNKLKQKIKNIFFIIAFIFNPLVVSIIILADYYKVFDIVDDFHKKFIDEK